MKRGMVNPMAKGSFLMRWRNRLLEPNYPNVGIEFSSNAIRIAVLMVTKDRILLQHMDTEPIPEGSLVVNPFKPNIQSIEIVADAMKRLWERNRHPASRISILLQDRSAVTFHVQMEQSAGNREECLSLIRFKLKKSVPFRIEEASISYFTPDGGSDPRAKELWVTVLNHAILHQYEQLTASALGAQCGLADLSTFNLINLAQKEVRGMGNGDYLYVNLNRDYISIAISQSGSLTFYRSRDLEGKNGLLDDAMSEIYPATVFYVDKLKGQGLSHAFLFLERELEGLGSRLDLELKLPSSILSPSGLNQFGQKIPAEYTPLLGLLVSRKGDFYDY